MPAKDPLVYVMHIRDSCRRIAEYVAAGGPEWISKPMVVDAICPNISHSAYNGTEFLAT